MVTQRTRPEPGYWTYADLEALPDDGRRYEIVEGVLWEMTAPTWEHGAAVLNLIALLLPYVRAVGGTMRTAPQDVFFPGADPVQPDIFAVLPGNPGQAGQRGFVGAPDLVVEVLSPSTRGRDALTKRSLYAQAGVKEYWLVDAEARSIEVLVLDGGVLHSFLVAAGDDTVRSRLLPSIAFPASDAFGESELA
jgi:Uma2 family endonuclease